MTGFLDLIKDTVNYDFLVHKLEIYDMKCLPLKFLKQKTKGVMQ